MILYRVQDKSGRGPWRPGFSHEWADPTKDISLCPPMMAELPDWRRSVARHPWLTHWGCCAHGLRGVHRWFTPLEIDRLRALGFHLVDASGMTPICIGESQVLAGSRFPLSYLPVVDWVAAE